MCEYDDYGWDAGGGEDLSNSGSNYGWNPDGSDTSFGSEEIPEDVGSVSNEPAETTEPVEEIPEDTQSDLEKVNHPNMSLEEVQELQGVKENEDGKLETTGEGTGNEAFQESLPEEYTQSEGGQPSDEYRKVVDDNYAEQEKMMDDSDPNTRETLKGFKEDGSDEPPEDTSSTEQGPRVIKK